MTGFYSIKSSSVIGSGPQYNNFMSEGQSTCDLPIDIKLATVKNKMALKSNLSVNMRNENNEIEEVMIRMKTIEASKEKDKALSKIDKVNCQNMILQTNRQIKTLHYQLSRVIPKNDDHLIIHPKKQVEIEVIPETLMSYRVSSRACLSPAKFTISQRAAPHSKFFHTDLKVYLSTFHKEPKDGMCQKLYLNPDKIMFYSSGKEEFEADNIYISFYSLSGCSITVSVVFPDRAKNNKNKKFNDEESDGDAPLQKKPVHDDLIYKKLLADQQKYQNVDFV